MDGYAAEIERVKVQRELEKPQALDLLRGEHAGQLKFLQTQTERERERTDSSIAELKERVERENHGYRDRISVLSCINGKHVPIPMTLTVVLSQIVIRNQGCSIHLGLLTLVQQTHPGHKQLVVKESYCLRLGTCLVRLLSRKLLEVTLKN